MGQYLINFEETFLSRTIYFHDEQLDYFNCADLLATSYLNHQTVDLSLVKGTEHGSYAGYTWGELICGIEQRGHSSLHRGWSNYCDLKRTPEYYLSDELKEGWSFARYRNHYYIQGGNHRTILAKYFLEMNQLDSLVKGVSVTDYADIESTAYFENTDFKNKNIMQRIKKIFCK